MHRNQTIAPFLPFLKLFLTALGKLPGYNSTKHLWCGVTGNSSSVYTEGKKYWWWRISSCSVDIKTAAEFIKTSEEPFKLLLHIHFWSQVVDISEFSVFPEKEVLLFPTRYLKVHRILETDGFTLVDLMEEEKIPNMLVGINVPERKQKSYRYSINQLPLHTLLTNKFWKPNQMTIP
jgi:hypothetical protein